VIYSQRSEGAIVEPGGGLFDRDLDNQPRGRIPTPGDAPYEYQRLVVNPFLTVLVWIIFLGLLRTVVPTQNAAGLVADILVFLLTPLLIQFHCLDCGATGWLAYYQRHACPKVVERWQRRVVRRFHGPGISLQLIAWFIFIIAALVLVMVWLRS
jgi:hypothetical protein